MGCLGVFFALTNDELTTLLRLKDDEAVYKYIREDIEEAWDESRLQQVDKSWDAMHRCLTDGTLDDRDDSPLCKCVLGGAIIYSRDDFIARLKPANEIQLIATAIAAIDQSEFSTRYEKLQFGDYKPFFSEVDKEYTWEYFQEVKHFYNEALKSKRAVLFSADQ